MVCGVDGADQIANDIMRENNEVLSCIVKEKMQRTNAFGFDRVAQASFTKPISFVYSACHSENQIDVGGLKSPTRLQTHTYLHRILLFSPTKSTIEVY